MVYRGCRGLFSCLAFTVCFVRHGCFAAEFVLLSLSCPIFSSHAHPRFRILNFILGHELSCPRFPSFRLPCAYPWRHLHHPSCRFHRRPLQHPIRHYMDRQPSPTSSFQHVYIHLTHRFMHWNRPTTGMSCHARAKRKSKSKTNSSHHSWKRGGS